MADDTKLHALTVSIEANTKGIEKALKRLADQNSGTFSKVQRDAQRSMSGVEKALASADKRMAGFGRSMLPTLGALSAALSVREVTRYADSWTAAGNKIAAASQIAGRAGRSLAGINKIANETRASFTETADLYAKLLRSTSSIAKNELEVAKATEIVAKAFKAGGAAASEQAAGILQLSQALGSGLLQGDELRSIRENAPLLARAIADEFKTTIAGLKDLGAEGKLTTDRVFRAILNAQPKIESAFAATNATIADSMTKVGNAMTEYVGQTDSSLGGSQRLVAGLNALADNFGATADMVLNLASVIAGALVGRSIVGMLQKMALGTAALASFGKALASVRTAGLAATFAGVGSSLGPIGAIIGTVVAGSLLLFSQRSDEASASARTYAAALEQVRSKAKEAAGAIDDTTKAIDDKARNELAGGVKEGTKEIEAATTVAVRELFEHLLRSADTSAVSPEQIAELQQIQAEFQNGTKSAKETEQALFALANADPNFQAVADSFSPLLKTIYEAIEAVDVLKNKLGASLDGPSFRKIEEKSMDDYREMKKQGDAYIKDANRRANLTKEQLALENEIAKVRNDALKEGVTLTETQIANIAKANIAGDTARNTKEKASEFEKLAKRVVESTAAQVAETEALRKTNPLVEDFGYNLRARGQRWTC